MLAGYRNDLGTLVRFVALGGANTAITMVEFLLLVIVVPYAVAYVVSFLTGVLINALLVARFVFRAPPSRITNLRVAAWSLVVMAVGAVLSGLCEQRGWSPLTTVFGVAAIIVPTNFLGTRLVVRRSTARADRDRYSSGGLASGS